MEKLIMANNFASYDEARDEYDRLCEKYGATRLDWGFGKWLWLPYEAARISDELGYWRALRKLGILTNDGVKRLARAEKAEAKVAAAKQEGGAE